jgi:hypothetical protein
MKRLYVVFTYHLIAYTANRNNSLIQQSLRTIEGPQVILPVRVVRMHSDCFPQGMQQGDILPHYFTLWRVLVLTHCDHVRRLPWTEHVSYTYYSHHCRSEAFLDKTFCRRGMCLVLLEPFAPQDHLKNVNSGHLLPL